MRLSARLAVAYAITTLLLLTVVGPVTAAELRVSGGATVGHGIIGPNQAAIEREAGLTLTVTVNGDGNGLKDLYAGRSDVAMVAAPMQVTEATLNQTAPGSLSIADFRLAPVGAVSIHFVVNPTNPVKSLSAPQLRDIFTGKIRSWREVGGADAPIVVIAEVAGHGSRTNVEVAFLAGEQITAHARTMQALVQVMQVVAQLPNAISYGNATSITGSVAVLPGVEVKQELGLVTKGAPGPDALRLIAAVTKFGTAIK
jgi:phosphate transport system substrate-binding protein